jgi:hypothetical protein
VVAVTRQTRLTGSFVATDGAGNRHTLHVFTEFVLGRDPGTGERRETAVNGTIKTDAGHLVIRLGKGEYQLVYPRTLFRSDDPAAP